MLLNTKEIYGHKLAATDGDIGHIRDFYFDDKSWVVRYLVADTGSWLTGRLVLISPHAFGDFDRAEKTLSVHLTKKRIEGCPSIEMHRPVSRQYEIDYYRYYGWPAYWDGAGMWGMGSFPVVTPPSRDELASRGNHDHRSDKHLQSALSVNGYHLHATDGTIGHVTGFMVDDKSWTIRELVVETGHWYAGKEVLISPTKISEVSYEKSTVGVHLSMADIRRTEENRVVQSAHAHGPTGGFPRE